MQEIKSHVSTQEAQAWTREQKEKKSRAHLQLLLLLLPPLFFIIRLSSYLSFQTQSEWTWNRARLRARAPLGWTAGGRDVTTWRSHAWRQTNTVRMLRCTRLSVFSILDLKAEPRFCTQTRMNGLFLIRINQSRSRSIFSSGDVTFFPFSDWDPRCAVTTVQLHISPSVENHSY